MDKVSYDSVDKKQGKKKKKKEKKQKQKKKQDERKQREKATQDESININKNDTNEENEKKDQIVVETINILVSTNIPNEKDISLTSKVLVGTSPNIAKYNEYPYITSSIQFKKGFLLNMNRNDILDFFFIKDVFVKTTNRMNTATRKEVDDPPTKPEDMPEHEFEELGNSEREAYLADFNERLEQFEKDKKEWDQRTESQLRKNTVLNLNENIEIMIRMLFDTYPVTGNVMQTLKSGYITKTYNVNKYAYLNINAKDYTISKVIWINDIYNHYLSKQFVKDFKEFNAWRTGETRNISNSIDDTDSQRTSLIAAIKESSASKNSFRDDIVKIENYLFNPSNWMNNTQSLMTIRNAMEILYAHLVILRSEWKSNNTIQKKKDRVLSVKKTEFEAERTKNDNTKTPRKEGVNREEEDGLNGGMGRGNMDVSNRAASNRAISDSDYKDMIDRIDSIEKTLSKSKYNLKESDEFMIELNRVANIIIGSNLIPLTNIVQTTIKDLSENNQKRISLENDKRYIENEKIILGNDKYKNNNFKTLSDAFMKNVQLIKKVSNYKYYKGFDYEKIMEFYKKLQYPRAIDPDEDAFGIIYDNNNVTTPKYGIYMYIDLTEGKVTDANNNNLDLCSFRDELLLLKFNQLKNNEGYVLQHDPLIKILDTGAEKKPDVGAKPLQGGQLTHKVYRKSNNNKTKKYMKL